MESWQHGCYVPRFARNCFLPVWNSLFGHIFLTILKGKATRGSFYPLLIFVRGWIDPRTTVLAEGLSQRKIGMKQSGIDPTTFYLVEKCI